MVALVRFLFTFFLGWIFCVWIYDVPSPMKRLPEIIHTKVENFKNVEFLGMRVFEKPRNTTEDISLPNELRPSFKKLEDTEDVSFPDNSKP